MTRTSRTWPTSCRTPRTPFCEQEGQGKGQGQGDDGDGSTDPGYPILPADAGSIPRVPAASPARTRLASLSATLRIRLPPAAHRRVLGGAAPGLDRVGVAEPPAVRFNGVSKRYGNSLVLDNVNFDLPKGTFAGLIGLLLLIGSLAATWAREGR